LNCRERLLKEAEEALANRKNQLFKEAGEALDKAEKAVQSGIPSSPLPGSSPLLQGPWPACCTGLRV